MSESHQPNPNRGNHSRKNTVVTRQVMFEWLQNNGDSYEVDSVLSYDSHDPFAVSVQFHADSDKPVKWQFSRELLADGIYEPTGDGDVHVWPCLTDDGKAVVVLELTNLQQRSSGEIIMLQAYTREITDFMHETERAVAFGQESAYLKSVVDHAIAQCMQGGSSSNQGQS